MKCELCKVEITDKMDIPHHKFFYHHPHFAHGEWYYFCRDCCPVDFKDQSCEYPHEGPKIPWRPDDIDENGDLIESEQAEHIPSSPCPAPSHVEPARPVQTVRPVKIPVRKIGWKGSPMKTNYSFRDGSPAPF